jgi:chorismate dehydratase
VAGSQSLRIGCVKYLNARPLIHGWPGAIIFNHPAALSAQLQQRDLDLALVSSFEFLRNPIYRVIEGISVCCDGPVYSVVLAHGGEISDIEEIGLDPASVTSAALLRVLLAELSLQPRLSPVSNGEVNSVQAKLLIGDQAIRFRNEHPELNFWDLGEAWQKTTNLPFVFALWLVRPEVTDTQKIADRLRRLRDVNLSRLDQIIADEREFDGEFCRRYFLDHLRFSFGEREKEGLRTFAELCAKHGLIPKQALALNLI